LLLAAMAFPSLRALVGDLPLPGSVIRLGVGIAALLALVSGLPPAVRAQRLNIVDALAGR